MAHLTAGLLAIHPAGRRAGWRDDDGQDQVSTCSNSRVGAAIIDCGFSTGPITTCEGLIRLVRSRRRLAR